MSASEFPIATPSPAGYGDAFAATDFRRFGEFATGWANRPVKLTRSQELQARVVAALMRSGYSALAWVGCDVRGDQVILRGSVPSYHLKQLAQVFAQRVDGVERIQNCLEVSRRLPA